MRMAKTRIAAVMTGILGLLVLAQVGQADQQKQAAKPSVKQFSEYSRLVVTLHSLTSGYWPITLSHAVADGRIIIRGARGIFCYDLRKPATDTEQERQP